MREITSIETRTHNIILQSLFYMHSYLSSIGLGKDYFFDIRL